MASLLQDLRYGFRLLTRQPGLWVLAVLTLSIGTGVNATLVSFSRALMQGLSLFDAERTVVVYPFHPELERSRVTADDFRDLERESRALRGWFAHERMYGTVTGEGDAARVSYERVSPRFLSAVGARAEQGRLLTAADFEAGRPAVALLSWGWWQSHYGGAPGIVGRRLQIDGVAHEIVGVATRETWFPTLDAKLWVPYRDSEIVAGARAARNIRVFAELAPGITREQAREELAALSRRFEQARPETNTRWTYVPQDLRTGLFSENDRTAVFLIQLLGVGLLAIACANVANLLLVHAIGRRREFAVRNALGAGGVRLVRQLVGESLMFAIPATILGLLMAGLGAEWAFRRISERAGVPVPPQMVDPQVIAVSLGVAVLSLVLFNLPAAWQARRLDLVTAMRDGGARSGTQNARSGWLARGFVVGQFAVALALVIFAGLVARGVEHFHSMDIGYPVERLLVITAHPSAQRYATSEQARAYYQRGLAELRALPAVESAGLMPEIPQFDGNGFSTLFASQAERGTPAERQRRASLFVAGEGALETLGVPLRSGRRIDRRDTASAERVAVANEEAVRQLGFRHPLGERVCFGARITGGECYTLVGVLADIKPANLAQPAHPSFFVPESQVTIRDQQWLVRTRGDAAAALPLIRPKLAALDHQEPLEFQIVTESNYREQEGTRLFSLIVNVMGGLALFLAAVGLFCLMAFQASQQRREWGIRLALGASAFEIRRRVTAAGLRLLTIGALPGLAVAYGLARVLSGMLPPGVTRDWTIWLTGPLVLLAVGLISVWVPAHRASRVDPVTALQED